MDEVLVRNWKAKVKQADTVFVLGDAAFGTKESVKSIISRLNGRKTLVLAITTVRGLLLSGWRPALR